MKNCRAVGEKSCVFSLLLFFYFSHPKCFDFSKLLPVLFALVNKMKKGARGGFTLPALLELQMGWYVSTFIIIVIIVLLFTAVISHRDVVAVGSRRPAGTDGSWMLVPWCTTALWFACGWRLGSWAAFCPSASSAECLFTICTCGDFENKIHRMQDTAEFSPQAKKKEEKKKNMGIQWKASFAWPSGELECCSCYMQIHFAF